MTWLMASILLSLSPKYGQQSFQLLSDFWLGSLPSVQLGSVTQLCPTFCDPMNYSMTGFPVHHQLLKLAQTHVHQVSDAIQPSHPLSSPSPIFNLSQDQGLFQGVSSTHQVAKDLALSFSISPYNDNSELISFRVDCFDILTVQRTHKSLLQHHSSKASILWHSASLSSSSHICSWLLEKP